VFKTILMPFLGTAAARTVHKR